MPPFWSIMPLLLGSSDIEPLVLHNQAPFNMPPIFFRHACRMLHSTWLNILHFNMHHAPITCRKFPFNMHHAPKTCRMLQFMRKNDMPPSSFNIPKPPSNMPPNSTYTAIFFRDAPCPMLHSKFIALQSHVSHHASSNSPKTYRKAPQPSRALIGHAEFSFNIPPVNELGCIWLSTGFTN